MAGTSVTIPTSLLDLVPVCPEVDIVGRGPRVRRFGAFTWRRVSPKRNSPNCRMAGGEGGKGL